MARTRTYLGTLGALLVVLGGCNSGSGVTGAGSSHAADAAVTLEPVTRMGPGAVEASSPRYRMVSTFGPSVAASGPRDSPEFRVPVDLR